MKTYRNLIIVNLGSDVEKEGVRYFGSTSFAQNQAMIHINAKTPEKFIELVRDEEIKIVGYILRHERETYPFLLQHNNRREAYRRRCLISGVCL